MGQLEYFCSKYIKEINSIVKGEVYKRSDRAKAVVTVTNLVTEQEGRGFVHTLMRFGIHRLS